MLASLPPCHVCGGALQRVASMAGHVVCGSGHLFLEAEALPPEPPSPRLTRVGDKAAGPTGA